MEVTESRSSEASLSFGGVLNDPGFKISVWRFSSSRATAMACSSVLKLLIAHSHKMCTIASSCHTSCPKIAWEFELVLVFGKSTRWWNLHNLFCCLRSDYACRAHSLCYWSSSSSSNCLRWSVSPESEGIYYCTAYRLSYFGQCVRNCVCPERPRCWEFSAFLCLKGIQKLRLLALHSFSTLNNRARTRWRLLPFVRGPPTHRSSASLSDQLFS